MTAPALIVGVGNLLRGDDGFGVEVARRLAALPEVTARARVVEAGIAGVHLVQELMDGYELLVIADAVDRGGRPGQLWVLEVEPPALPGPGRPEALTDLHEAVPARALILARALGVLPRRTVLVGCQPAVTEELELALSPAVAGAVEEAVARIRALVGAAGPAEHGAAGGDPVAGLARRDEVLQVVFWLQGEGLGPEVGAADVLRFIEDPTAVEATLDRLVAEGWAEARPDPAGGRRYRLTPLGEREGRRRFLDEFEPYLARRAHGECGTPDCGCHTGEGECRNLP